MRKTIFFSGTHGCGKTTTINEVSTSQGIPIFSSSDGDHGNPYIEPFQRQVWRIRKYYLDSLEVLKQRNQTPQNHLLVDRCVFDHTAYTNAFHRMKLLTDNQYFFIKGLKEKYFEDENMHPTNVVLFYPSEQWTIERIKQRWNEEKKKWNEGDFDYLRILRDEYQQIYEQEAKKRNILIVTETNLESRVKIVSEFIASI